ncbi:MAG: serine/threonine protein kinase [Fuerstiella sp.]|nr:serine/threonine protein kinase [Fuerstiella sp.]
MSDSDSLIRNEETDFRLLGLPQPGPDVDLRSRTPVELLASQFVDELRRGERPSVATYAKRYPLHADVIRESFPVLGMLEQARLQNESRAMRRSIPRQFPFTRLGRCELLCELGRGGMGVVYQGRDIDSKHIVAVKVLPWRVSMVPDWQNRFEEEARTAARLRHRNIVPVYRFGQEHGYCYYTMQFINGVTLEQIIARLKASDGVVYQDEIARNQQNRPDGFVQGDSGPNRISGSTVGIEKKSRRPRLTRESWRAFTQIAMQVCEGLRYAHQHQLVHNDVKPANILISADGRVWITDFGLSGTVQTSESTSEAVAPHGTLRYMAPERFAGAHDLRSDLYSLGLTLYEMLTLQQGFDADSEAELIQRISEERVVRPSVFQPNIPRDLETIVMNCIEKRPEDRYQSTESLYSDLLLFSRGQRVSTTRRGRLSLLWNQWIRR